MTLSRRDFVGAAGAALVAGAFPRLLRGAPGAGISRPANAPATVAELVELRRGVGIFASRGGTIGWLTNSSGAVAVDSQFPDTAAECLAGLRGRGVGRIDALINTHHHGDHTGGNAVFREAARRIVGHRRVPELQRRAEATARAAGGNPPEPIEPDTTFDTGWSREVGDETVRAKHFGPAHTGGDCVVHFERADVVHMGDLVFNRAYPFIDRAGGASTAGWIETLETVASDHGPSTIFVFGHARPDFPVTGTRDDVLVQRDFLGAALDAVHEAVAAGHSREEVMATRHLPGFDDHVALNERLSLGHVLGVVYDEVTGA